MWWQVQQIILMLFLLFIGISVYYYVNRNNGQALPLFFYRLAYV